MRSISDAHGLPNRREDDPAARPASIFWMAALGAVALALLAVYGGGAITQPSAAQKANLAAPATPFGELVQLTERLNRN